MAKFNRIQPKKASLDKGDLSLLKLGPRHFPMKDNSKKLNNTADFIFSPEQKSQFQRKLVQNILP